MKVIDLLNKIANGEEEPKKIEKKIDWYLLEKEENKGQLIEETNLNFRELREKLYEIIDYINSKEE